MIRVYTYKLNPNIKQTKLLNAHMGCVRFVYNWALNKRIESYSENKKSIPYVELAKQLTQLRNDEDHKWMKDVASECLQQSLLNLDKAYTQFFREKKGFPHFKSKRNKQSIKFINNIHFDFDKMKVKIPKLGWVRIFKNRTFDASLKIGTLTVTKDRCGTYWCSIVVHTDENIPSKAKMDIHTSVGIDLGIKHYLILSNGTKIDNPKFFEKDKNKLKLLQQRLSRKKKGSNRRKRAQLKVNKCYRSITNKRLDFIHRITYRLMHSQFDTFILEDLNIKSMMEDGNTHLSRMIQDASWNEFKRQMIYKADMYGKNVLFIGRYEPSSKLCHKCGFINRELTLDDREWECPVCGTKHDRDINAAINIRTIGFDKRNLIGTQLSPLYKAGSERGGNDEALKIVKS